MRLSNRIPLLCFSYGGWDTAVLREGPLAGFVSKKTSKPPRPAYVLLREEEDNDDEEQGGEKGYAKIRGGRGRGGGGGAGGG